MNGFTSILLASLLFVAAPVASQVVSADTTIDSPYVFVSHKMPIYPGCEMLAVDEQKLCSDRKLIDFVYGNLEIPPEFSQNTIVGKIIARFVIKEDGRVSKPEIIRALHLLWGQELLRVLQLMIDRDIRWTPGEDQNGNPLVVTFTFPLQIRLE